MEDKLYNDELPAFTDQRTFKKVWVKVDKTERVFIYINDNGTWGHWGEYFSDHDAEMCWIQDDMGGHYYDTEETAIKEVHASYPWSKDIGPINVNIRANTNT